MSLDIQEVQDICGHTALRARKWSGFINKRQKMQHYCTRSAEERRKNAKSLCFSSRGAYVNLRYIAMLYAHSFTNQP